MDTLIYVLLGLTSVIGLAFIVERALALRWSKVVPPEITGALSACETREDAEKLRRVCTQKPSPLGRLLMLASERLDWPKEENVDALQTAARHEIVRLERGLVVLEIIVGIAPLLGLLGAVSGLVSVFAAFGSDVNAQDPHGIAKGISEALSTTIVGLAIAIPSLIANSYYSKKIETMAADMELLIADLLAKCYYHQALHAHTAKAAPDEEARRYAPVEEKGEVTP